MCIGIRQKNIFVFLLTIPTLILSAFTKVFIASLASTVKSDTCPVITLLKKNVVRFAYLPTIFFIRPQEFCCRILIMDYHRPCVERNGCVSKKWFLWYNLSCSWWILLNFEHKDHWPWIKVSIDLGYSYHIQTRDPKVKKLMFLLFVLEELIFIWFWWMFFNEFQKNTFKTCIALLCI